MYAFNLKDIAAERRANGSLQSLQFQWHVTTRPAHPRCRHFFGTGDKVAELSGASHRWVRTPKLPTKKMVH